VFQERIAASAYAQQREIEAGRQVVVGVNQYANDEPASSVPAPDYSALAAGSGSVWPRPGANGMRAM